MLGPEETPSFGHRTTPMAIRQVGFDYFKVTKHPAQMNNSVQEFTRLKGKHLGRKH